MPQRTAEKTSSAHLKFSSLLASTARLCGNPLDLLALRVPLAAPSAQAGVRLAWGVGSFLAGLGAPF